MQQCDLALRVGTLVRIGRDFDVGRSCRELQLVSGSHSLEPREKYRTVCSVSLPKLYSVMHRMQDVLTGQTVETAKGESRSEDYVL